MSSIKSIREANNIDVKWSSEKLVDSIGFQSRAGNRIKDYLKDHGIEELSFREFMGLFLPTASNHHKSETEFWSNISILRQPQFGIYLYDSALLTLTEAELGSAFRAECMQRIYSLKLHELRHSPANKGRLNRINNWNDVKLNQDRKTKNKNINYRRGTIRIKAFLLANVIGDVIGDVIY